MTSTQKQKFIEASKNPNYKQFDGHVCLGYGGYPDLSEQLNINSELIFSYWRDRPNELSCNWGGGSKTKSYYLTQEKWNELFGEVEDNTPKAYRFDSQEELDNLVAKYGKDYFEYVPSVWKNDFMYNNTKGYIFKVTCSASYQ